MYLIETPHTKEECLRALDETLAKNPERIEEFKFACSSGDHTGWAFVEMASENEARGILPDFLKGKAKVREVKSYTADQIRAFHGAGAATQPTA